MRIKTTPDVNPSYEQKRGAFVEWFRARLIKTLGLLPPKLAQKVFLAFSGENGDPTVVFRNVATWRALEVLYTYRNRRRVNFASVFWQNFLDNSRSIRNRLALVKKELGEVIRQRMRNNGDEKIIRLLSIGSGSARSVLETIALLNHKHQVEIMLIDVDQTALKFSETLASRLGVNYTTRLTGNFFRLERDAAKFNPNVVELVGLLDYLTNKQVVVLLGKVNRILAPDGCLITGNILPNPEAPFVTKGITWPMTYRTPKELKNLLVESGFPPDNIRIEEEPLGIHMVAVAQKLSSP